MALGEDSTLESLLDACAAGDQRALKQLYDRESPRLYGLALRILRQPSAAADAVQDAFLQIWQKAGTFDPGRGNAEAWLVSIVRYRALDTVRRRSKEVLSDDPGLGDTAEEYDPVAALSDRRDGARLRACLETLEERNRRAILLAFVDGLSHSEVAERIATPLGTVKAWIRRGMIALKGCLEFMIPEDPIERDALAGEYVLGVLDLASRAAVAAALEHDADLRRLVDEWQDRLQPLAAAVPPMPPPDDLWPRIAAALPQPVATVVPFRAKPGVWHNAGVWRLSTIGMTALAAGLAALMLVRNPVPAPGYIAVLTAPQNLEASFLVESRPRTGLVLTSLTHAGPASGHAYQLWAQAPGGAKLVSLGLIPAGGRLALDPSRIRPSAGTALMISLEPETGSPYDDRPTGPVVYQGQLIERQ